MFHWRSIWPQKSTTDSRSWNNHWKPLRSLIKSPDKRRYIRTSVCDWDTFRRQVNYKSIMPWKIQFASSHNCTSALIKFSFDMLCLFLFELQNWIKLPVWYERKHSFTLVLHLDIKEMNFLMHREAFSFQHETDTWYRVLVWHLQQTTELQSIFNGGFHV